MLLALVMPIRRRSEADEMARELLGKLARWVLLVIGLLVIVLGVAIAPLPGPGGIPVIVVGLMIVLRNSFAMRRRFVRFQRAHPKLIFPIRRLLRREPELLQVAWQQALRMERLVLPGRWRVAVRLRRRMKRRAARKAAA
jgi:predicted membrane chloride channel (bestrophin family)